MLPSNSSGTGSGGVEFALQIPSQFVDAIAHRVVELIDAGDTGPATPWVDVDGAAAYLSCSRQRIYDLVHAGALTPARDGRRLLFHRERTLDAYLLEGRPA